MNRRRKLKRGKYQNVFSEHIETLSSYSGIELTKSFIVTAVDKPKLFPKPDSIVALISDYDYMAKTTTKHDRSFGGNYQEPEDEDRSFYRHKATSADGVNQTRYFCVVDHIDDDGNIVIFDDKGQSHLFKDSEVMVVELYVYNAAAFGSTFVKDIDYSNELLSVNMRDLYTQNELCDVISDNGFLMYERVLLNLPNTVRAVISKIYLNRGLIYDNNIKVVRILLERTLLMGDTFSEGLTTFATECIRSLRDYGYHIDLISNKYSVGKDAQKDMVKSLRGVGIEYDTWNAKYKYDFIIDGRNAMSYGEIDWTVIHKNITGNELNIQDNTITEIVDESELIKLHKLGDDSTEKLLKKFGDIGKDNITLEEIVDEDQYESEKLGNVLDKLTENALNEQPQFDGSYRDFFNMSQESFEHLKESKELFLLYPLAPQDWILIKTLQHYKNDNIDYKKMNPMFQEFVTALGLREYFN